MKRHWIIALTAMFVLALVVSSAWVQAQPAGRGQGRGGGRGQGRGGGRRGFMRGSAPVLPDYTRGIEGLTDKQKKQIAEIRKAAIEKVTKIEEQMTAKIKGLLTPEQAKEMAAAKRRVTHRGPGGATMTDEQKKIIDAAREKAAKAESRQEGRRIMRDAFDKVRASYTEEQQTQAETVRGFDRPRRPRGGG